MSARTALALLIALLISTPARAQDPVPTARALLVAWHEDPARIDQARALLESAVVIDPRPDNLVALSQVFFLTGEFRARGDAERIAAYERGADWARRAISGAPNNDRAHFLLAINTGRLAEMKGVMRALPLVTTIREESQTVLRLNPTSVDGLILAGGLSAEMPSLMGGDRTRAETLFKRALELDPHQTGGRLELAKLYVATRRWQDAQRELQAVLDERAPTDVPRWTTSDRGRAQRMLAELYERGRAGGAAQAP